MSYRPLPPFVVFRDNEDIPLSGGLIQFYEPGTTTPKNVYSDENLTVNLGNEVTLNTAGRAPTAVWTSGDCRIRVYDSAGTLVDEEDPINDPALGGGLEIPSLLGHTGYYLTNDGVNLDWSDLSAYILPDMMGQAGKYLSNDGGTPVWSALVVDIPEGGIDVDTNTLTAGKLVIKKGTGSVSASGANQATGTLTFGTTFAAPPAVVVTPNTTNIAAGGYLPVFAVTSVTTTGANIAFDVNNDGTVPIINTINFTWIAMGMIP